MRYVTGYDGVPMTVERSASISTSVVVGTVEEVGPARWRTAGEEPPAERWEMTGDNVMRLLRIKVDEELAGAALDGTVVTWIPGGTIGCHVFQFGAYPVELKTGERFTFFLDTRRAPLEGIADVARVVEMWPVEGDDATSPTEGKVALSEVSARADPEVVEAP